MPALQQELSKSDCFYMKLMKYDCIMSQSNKYINLYKSKNVISSSCCYLLKTVRINKNMIILFHFYLAVQCLSSQWTGYSSLLNGSNWKALVKSSVYLPIIREEFLLKIPQTLTSDSKTRKYAFYTRHILLTIHITGNWWIVHMHGFPLHSFLSTWMKFMSVSSRQIEQRGKQEARLICKRL